MQKCILCEKDATHTIKPEGGRKTYWCNRHFTARIKSLEGRVQSKRLIPIKSDFELLRDDIIAKLKTKYIYAEVTDDGDLSFSLSQLDVGLQGYYVTLSKDEIQYHLENDGL